MKRLGIAMLASLTACSGGVGRDESTSYTVGNDDVADESGSGDELDGGSGTGGTEGTGEGSGSTTTDTGQPGQPGCNNGFVPGDYCPGVPISIPVGTGATGLAVTDFDQDGVDDIGLSLRGSDRVVILHSLGDGSFSGPSTFEVGASPWAVLASDITGDGKPELVSADYGASSVSVILNQGGGLYSVIGSFGAGESPIHVVTADFNGDGNADLAASNEMQGDATVSVLLSTGNSLAAPVGYGTGQTDVLGVEAVDLNNDGKPDLVAANEYGGLAIMLNNGDGTFGAPSTVAVGELPFALDSGDFDNDGNQDVVVGHVNSSDISVLFGDGAGGFDAPLFQPASAGVYAVRVADIDGDGEWDIAATGPDSTVIDVFLGSGNGTFAKQPGVNVGVGEPWDVAIGDFNNDGGPDMVVTDKAGGAIKVLLSTP